jgi:hypothetical protein
MLWPGPAFCRLAFPFFPSASKQNESKPAGRSPSLIAYIVIERESTKSKWREIGVAFHHNDSEGFDILCVLVPSSRRITVRSSEYKK